MRWISPNTKKGLQGSRTDLLGLAFTNHDFVAQIVPVEYGRLFQNAGCHDLLRGLTFNGADELLANILRKPRRSMFLRV